MIDIYDDDEAYADGDPPIDEIDWDDVTHLQHLMDEANALPEGEERSMAHLGLLHKMHGDELEVL